MNVEKKKIRVTVAVLMVFIMACVALTVSSSNVFAKSRPFFFRVSYNQENGQEADGWRRGNVPASLMGVDGLFDNYRLVRLLVSAVRVPASKETTSVDRKSACRERV